MNDRIRELAIAAAPVDSAIPQSEWNIPKEFIEKFAELIISECLNTVGHYANVDEGIAVAKKNFGVER